MAANWIFDDADVLKQDHDIGTAFSGANVPKLIHAALVCMLLTKLINICSEIIL